MNNLKDIINSNLENLLSEIYTSKGIKNGDITPTQNLQWDDIVNNLTDLFTELITQNKNEIKLK